MVWILEKQHILQKHLPLRDRAGPHTIWICSTSGHILHLCQHAKGFSNLAFWLIWQPITEHIISFRHIQRRMCGLLLRSRLGSSTHTQLPKATDATAIASIARTPAWVNVACGNGRSQHLMCLCDGPPAFGNPQQLNHVVLEMQPSAARKCSGVIVACGVDWLPPLYFFPAQASHVLLYWPSCCRSLVHLAPLQ